MSRVIKPKNKFVNSVKYSSEVYSPSKVKIIQPITDYTKAKSFSQWLNAKYRISYEIFSRKNKKKRIKLKEEYQKDCSI